MNIDELIQNFHLQKEEQSKLIEELDEEFSNKKLNPYGVTTIDFQKRSDAYSQRSRLEGAIDALFMVKRDIMGDDSEVGMPSFELNAEPQEEIEMIGESTESAIDDDNIPGDPSY